jgi:hypothetical protein
VCVPDPAPVSPPCADHLPPKAAELGSVRFSESLVVGDLGDVTKHVQSEPHAPHALSLHARVVADLSMCLGVPPEAVVFEQMEPWVHNEMRWTSILISFSEALLRDTTHVDVVRKLVSKVYDRRSELYAAGCSLEHAEDAAMILCQANARKVRIYLACDYAEAVGTDLLSTASASKNPSLSSSLRSAVVQSGGPHTSPSALCASEHSPRRRLAQAFVLNDSADKNPLAVSDLQLFGSSDDEQDLRQSSGADYSGHEKRTAAASDREPDVYDDIPAQTCADRFPLGTFNIGTPNSRANQLAQAKMPSFPTHSRPNAGGGDASPRSARCLDLWPAITRARLVGMDEANDISEAGSGSGNTPVSRPPSVPRVLTVSQVSDCSRGSSRASRASQDDRLSPRGSEILSSPRSPMSSADMLQTLQKEMERAAREQERKCLRARERERELIQQAETAHCAEMNFESRTARGLSRNDFTEYGANSRTFDDNWREPQRDRHVPSNASTGSQIESHYRFAGSGGSATFTSDNHTISPNPEPRKQMVDRTTDDAVRSRGASGYGFGTHGSVSSSCSSICRVESEGKDQTTGTTSNLYAFVYSAPTSSFYKGAFGTSTQKTHSYQAPGGALAGAEERARDIAERASERASAQYSAVQQQVRTASSSYDAFDGVSRKVSTSASYSLPAMPERPHFRSTYEAQATSKANRGAFEDALRSSALQRAKLRELQEEILGRRPQSSKSPHPTTWM